MWSFAEAWKGVCREGSVWVRPLFWAQWGQGAFYLQVWVGPYWFRLWSRGDTSHLVRVVTRTTGEMEALPVFNHLRGGEGSFQSPPVPSTFFWASVDVCGMIRRHLGMQQAGSSSFGVGVKRDHVSLPSPPPTPWDPGVRPLRVDRLIFSSVSSSQALLFFGFA